MHSWLQPLVLAGLWGALAAPATAQDEDAVPVPQVYNDLVACQQIADDGERLACYDRRVTALRTAAEGDQVMVVDREEVREAERGLFGLRLPRLFGSDEDRIPEIESTVTRVAGGGRRRPWVLSLADGSVWQQVDSEQLSRRPEAGHPIVIRRAALGSFRAEIDGMRMIRVRRIR